ncbi:hypothetical protein HOY82DRAFT_580211 [Tuber indicum]|nr:hypothetical protein HOY82DRAFT_580211 [Tuber indicum]
MGRNLKILVKLCSDWQLCSRASGYRGYAVARLCSFPGRGEVLPFWAWVVCPRRYLVLSLDGDAVVAMLC